MRGVELFGGPGGFSLGAHAALGVHLWGIENEPNAIATRRAAGLRTIESDVLAVDPIEFGESYGRPEVLIGAPPCQAWSQANDQRDTSGDVPLVVDYTRTLVRGGLYPREWYLERCADERSLLVVEPLRWALELRPRYIALEQVPPILDYWRLVASILEDHGYGAWTGILSAERYGVPQTRRRAFLLADRSGSRPSPPAPTHTAYVPGAERRDELTLEGELLPYVTMGEALGWTEESDGWRAAANERPAPTLAVGKTAAGRVFGSDERALPKFRGGGIEKGTERSLDEPAPTLTSFPSRHRSGWVHGRPATTVAGDPRVAAPGHKADAAYPDSPGRMADAITITPAEAAILQGFPTDYPFRGSATRQYEQIGNAVPPPLARAVLEALVR